MTLAKRAISSNDVFEREREKQGLSRTSSEYASIPNDIQSQLQSMSWRIRASTLIALTPDVNRGYASGTPDGIAGAPKHFSNAHDTIQGVKSSFHQWGRTATMPTGTLRGMTPHPSPSQVNMNSCWSSDTDTSFNSLNMPNLKRGIGEEDTDAILANCFDEDEGSWAPMQSSERENQPLDEERVLRPLPSRGSFRPTKSMPPLRELPADVAPQNIPGFPVGPGRDDAMATDEPFHLVDFSAYATRTDGF